MKVKTVAELPPHLRASAAAELAKQGITPDFLPHVDEERSKFGNEKSDGYASKHEAKRAAELQLLLAAGRISELRTQVAYELIPAQREGDRCLERACSYFADFVYIDNETGARVVEDAKGYRDAVYRIKRKLMLKVHGIRVRET